MDSIESRPSDRNRPPAGRATVPPRARDLTDDGATVRLPQVPVMRSYRSRNNAARWPNSTPHERCDTGLVL